MRNTVSTALVVAIVVLSALPAVGTAAEPKLDPAAAPAGHYVLDARHASVTARVRHMGLSLYTMRFDHVEASYDYDPAQPVATRITVAIDAHSLDTGDAGVSKQFAAEFLDADRNPRITFNSTAIQATAESHGTVTGDLTLRGVTKPATLEVNYNGTAPGVLGGHRMGFSATTTVDRSAFGSGAWRGVVGDDVQIVIEAEFERK